MQGTILSNRYLLADEIGSGGMGSVFLATDLRTGAQVAVKVAHPLLARDPIYKERLRREAQIVASLSSPRIVRVLDLDSEGERLFLVMEYVPGPTLADELRDRGRLPPAEALTVTLEIGRALATAHQRGIIHRDLKPHNIKVLDQGEIKVLDFGIAKAEGYTGMTSASVFMGTPEYAAPERADGLGDIRSDIYSLGVMLYETLTGHRPFRASNPMALLRKHEVEPPPPLPDDIPPPVTAIVMRCLAKRPEDRYATPAELVSAVESALPALPQPVAVDHDRRAAHPAPALAPTILGAPLTPPPTAARPPTEPPPVRVAPAARREDKTVALPFSASGTPVASLPPARARGQTAPAVTATGAEPSGQPVRVQGGGVGQGGAGRLPAVLLVVAGVATLIALVALILVVVVT